MNRGGRLRVFAYVDAEYAHLYRAIMGRFMEAKERFRIHLRPQEVLAALDPAALAWTPADPLAAVRDLLRSLRDWGNLDEHPDTADVATVEEFYQPRFLYQLTAEGEAAERAISHFIENIRDPGELQAAALDDIRHLLRELERLIDEPSVDGAKVALTLRSLRERFDELTVKAQVFVGSLQRTIDLRGASVANFVAYKDLLIEYLERFIGELVIATAEIATTLERLDGRRLESVFELVAARELADAVDAGAVARQQAIERWRGRWMGLRSWFIGSAAAPSQAEALRARARSAIPALLSAAAARFTSAPQRAQRSRHRSAHLGQMVRRAVHRRGVPSALPRGLWAVVVPASLDRSGVRHSSIARLGRFRRRTSWLRRRQRSTHLSPPPSVRAATRAGGGPTT